MPTAVSILLTAGLALLDIKKSTEIHKIAIVKDKTVTKIERRKSPAIPCKRIRKTTSCKF